MCDVLVVIHSVVVLPVIQILSVIQTLKVSEVTRSMPLFECADPDLVRCL